MLFLKNILCLWWFWTQRDQPRCATSQNSQRRRRTNPIWTQGMPLVHQRKTIPLKSPLRKTLLPKAQPSRSTPLSWSGSGVTVVLTISGVIRQFSQWEIWREASCGDKYHTTHRMTLPTPTTCVKAEKGQAWLLQCRQRLGDHGALRGHPASLEEPSLWAWGTHGICRCWEDVHSQGVVTTRDPKRADRDTHLGCPDLPSVSFTKLEKKKNIYIYGE